MHRQVNLLNHLLNSSNLGMNLIKLFRKALSLIFLAREGSQLMLMLSYLSFETPDSQLLFMDAIKEIENVFTLINHLFVI